MKTKKRIALFLSLLLALSMILPVSAALAVDEGENKGMEISKTATKNDDGTYTITLEAYATGEKISTEITKDVPTDIILVLDQSGSMDYNMTASPTVTYQPYDGSYPHLKTNSNLYNHRHNDNGNDGNLYYQLPSGQYATVSVVRTQGEGSVTYPECPESWPNEELDPRNLQNYYANKDNLYAKNDAGEYQKVTLAREWVSTGIIQGYYRYTYTFPDGSTFVSDKMGTSPGDFGGRGPLYIYQETAGEYTYTYTCTGEDGNTINIGTSTGADTNFEDATLYYRNETAGETIKRVDALKDATRNFVNSVNRKAAGQDGQLGTDDDINHRVAVVGFASQTGNGYNTELLSISGSNSGSVGVAYNDISNQNLKDVLQRMDTTGGQDMVNSAISALATNGATRADLGLDMAQRILAANPVPEGEKRNRVVVFFTDGQPTNSNGFETSVANAAITQAGTIKNGGADVYAIGIFDGADATSAGIASGHSQRRENKFMQDVSSNNGTPQTPSYYLSASDSSTLNNIFEQISDNIQTGGSSVNLGSETVIKDIISPQFQLPDGTTADKITLETYSYTGENQWTKNDTAMGAQATVNGDQVSVTGFNFKENWCGTETINGNTTYRGNKLVISFPVKVKDGFLGGNGVYTNTSAGVYENGTATEPLFTFDRPQVDVEIKDITVTPEEKNVYLLGDLTAEQIKSGATAKVGDVELNLGAENYGLESWQYEYVDITVTYQDKDSNTVTNLNDLTDDTTYTVSVKVSPKTTGTATEKTDTGNANINVFKPELTFKDSDVYYGAAVPTVFSGNKVDPDVWKHGDKTSTEQGVTMIGDVPTLGIAYTPDATKITDGKVNTKQDIPVKVEVKIDNTDVNQYVTFAHQACVPACGWNETELNGDPAFLLHVKTCQLTITKAGGANDEPYVFTVKKDGTVYSEVTIVGNDSETIYELPVGTYTIEENTGWSWRYTANNGDSAELTAQNPTGSITCTNTKVKNYWLNGYSSVEKNVFGVAKQ